jgi:hypothetical protein
MKDITNQLLTPVCKDLFKSIYRDYEDNDFEGLLEYQKNLEDNEDSTNYGNYTKDLKLILNTIKSYTRKHKIKKLLSM